MVFPMVFPMFFRENRMKPTWTEPGQEELETAQKLAEKAKAAWNLGHGGPTTMVKA